MTSGDLFSVLSDLRGGRIAPEGLYSVLHRFGREHFVEAKGDIERYLQHPDPQIRYIALNVLTLHWMCWEHRRTCEAFLTGDPDSDNRRMGASGLAALLEGSRDPAALASLLRAFRNESEEWDVRDAAYSAILYVLGRPAAEQPPSSRRLDHGEIDWNRVEEAEQIVSGSGQDREKANTPS